LPAGLKSQILVTVRKASAGCAYSHGAVHFRSPGKFSYAGWPWENRLAMQRTSLQMMNPS